MLIRRRPRPCPLASAGIAPQPNVVRRLGLPVIVRLLVTNAASRALAADVLCPVTLSHSWPSAALPVFNATHGIQ